MNRKFWVARIIDTYGGTTAVLFGMPADTDIMDAMFEAIEFDLGHVAEVEPLDTFLGNTFMELVTI